MTAPRYVIDASVAVEYVCRTPLGVTLDSIFENCELIAPEIIDVEVMDAVRGMLVRRILETSHADTAIDRLAQVQITRVSHLGLWNLAWRHRHNTRMYDAIYLAVAQQNAVPLLTIDRRLARAPITDITVHDLTEPGIVDALTPNAPAP